jgi:hypothetical protein
MNLFSWITYSGHKKKKRTRSSCGQKQYETVLSSEQLEPRQCLSAAEMPGGVYRSGNINQADIALLADVARARYDVDGSGVKVGIISTSYNYLGGADYDIEHGSLPDNVTVVHDDNHADDEGRAMAQLVHSIAPGAELYVSSWKEFGTDSTTMQQAMAIQETFAERINDLVERGCNVIVDDIYDPFEPWFQDGPVSIAVDDAVNQGVTYFSAASNNSNVSYQSEVSLVHAPSTLIDKWNDSDTGTSPEYTEALSDPSLRFHNFAQGNETNVLQEVSIPNYGPTSTFVVQWDQIWGANNSAVEVWFFDKDKTPIGKAPGQNKYPIAGTLFAGMPAHENQPALPPFEKQEPFFVAFTYDMDGFKGDNHPHGNDGKDAPTFLKWIATLNGIGVINDDPHQVTIDPPSGFQGSSTAWGHNNSRLGAAVGAAAYWNTPAYNHKIPLLTSFSSWGGTPIFFDLDENGETIRLPEPEIRQQPKFTAPQEGDTTFFGEKGYEYNLLPNFQGTSAAAPNTAAVASLMRQLNPSLAPSDIYGILAETAVRMPNPYYHPPDIPDDQFNYATGAGLIQAEDAVAAVADISIQGKVFEDFGRDGRLNRGDRTLAGYEVFLDSNRNGIHDAAPQPESNNEFISFYQSEPLLVKAGAKASNPNRWPEKPPGQNFFGPYGNVSYWPKKAFSPIIVSEMPGTIIDLELTYEITPTSNATSESPFFLTLVSPLGIRVPVVGTKIEGGSFNNNGSLHVTLSYILSDTETKSSTISMGVETGAQQSLVDLNAFKDTPANGEWYLEVMNPDPNREYVLENWSLSLKTEEPITSTASDGTYEFPGSLLSFSSAVGAYTPMVELPDNQFITTNTTTEIGIRNLKPTVNIGISLPRVERPELLPSTKIIVNNSVPGPNPFVFSWNSLATSLLPSVSGVRFVVDSVRGTVEKKSGDTWVNVSAPPTTSNPRELLRLLSLRIIKPSDELRWIPQAESAQAEEAFSLIGWNGKFASESKSSIRFEMV